ncbi:unnamed protein product [Symbiodinium microadriaticum]|nr:unnamed protein product [Symbiodinium microadriaticum]
MSATLSPRLAESLALRLGSSEPAPILRSEGKQFDVELRYTGRDRRLLRATQGFEKKADMAAAVTESTCEALRWSNEETGAPGDVLCFLPGEPEIRRCKKHLEDRLAAEQQRAKTKVKKKRQQGTARGFGAPPKAPSAAEVSLAKPIDVLPLHGALDGEAQDLAVRAGPLGRRRVILATNVAEASITVQGVTAVVDTGLRKRSVFDRARGLNKLEMAAVSAASADQRRGRAGRLRPGLCLRLWSADEKLQEEDAPAIAEEDLTGTVLSLAASGVPPGSVQSLSWLDPPPLESLDHAVEVLTLLGAFENKEDSKALSPHGVEMARLPLHPRLAHLALKAPTIQDDGTEDADSTVAELCALLEQERGAKVSAAPRCADARVRLLALKTRALPDRRMAESRGLKGIRAIPGQCQQELPAATKAVRIRNPGPFLALAYPERIARLESTKKNTKT